MVFEWWYPDIENIYFTKDGRENSKSLSKAFVEFDSEKEYIKW
jgi:hypothetical protein